MESKVVQLLKLGSLSLLSQNHDRHNKNPVCVLALTLKWCGEQGQCGPAALQCQGMVAIVALISQDLYLLQRIFKQNVHVALYKGKVVKAILFYYVQ